MKKIFIVLILALSFKVFSCEEYFSAEKLLEEGEGLDNIPLLIVSDPELKREFEVLADRGLFVEHRRKALIYLREAGYLEKILHR